MSGRYPPQHTPTGQAPPRGAPLPQPGGVPLPQPGGVPLPQPGGAPRPQPGGAPRPQPGGAPRLQPGAHPPQQQYAPQRPPNGSHPQSGAPPQQQYPPNGAHARPGAPPPQQQFAPQHRPNGAPSQAGSYAPSQVGSYAQSQAGSYAQPQTASYPQSQSGSYAPLRPSSSASSMGSHSVGSHSVPPPPPSTSSSAHAAPRPPPQHQRPSPTPAPSAAPSRPVPGVMRPLPPGMASLAASLSATSLGGAPSAPSVTAASAPRAASVADPSFLPRPSFAPAALNARVACGDPPPDAPPNDLAPPGAMGRVGAHEPAACSPEVFIPCSGRNVRLCAGAFPGSVGLAKKYAMPLGAIVHPLAEPAPEESQIPIVNFGATGIVRCKRCRGYLSHACRFTDGGRRWMCCMCHYPNETPADYFSPLDANGRRRDAANKPELHRGSYAVVAPAEYMVRPPMPPIYFFVLEVTPATMISGALAAMVAGIKSSMSAIPDSGRTRIGLMTFDSAVQFYTLSSEGADPSVSIVADISEMFIPAPENILVQLAECRDCFEKALDMLLASCKVAQSAGNKPSSISSASCLGAALQGAQKVLDHWGGKMIVFAASRPTTGPGSLRDRADNNALGTDRERAVLRTESTFYRTMATEFSKAQIGVDLFICPPPPSIFMDVVTIGQLSKYTGGEIFRAAGFEAYKDHSRLVRAVYRTISRATGFEAVMRVRATKSVRISHFHGRFFVRSTDLLAMPNVDSDKAYAVQFSFDEASIQDGPFCVQVALLYTTTCGERRIRVHTVSVPVTASISDLFCRVDAPATANLMLRIAAESVKDRVLDELKKNLTDRVVKALAAYRTVCQQQYQGVGGAGTSPGQFYLPDAMTLLPLYMHGMLRTGVLSRDSAAAFLFRFDDKTALIHAVDTMTIAQSSAFLYPTMIPVLPVPATANAEGAVKLPLPGGAPASAATLRPEFGVIIDDGQTILLWLGTAVISTFAAELLGTTPQAVGSNVDPRQLAYRLLEPVQRKGAVGYVKSVIDAVMALRPAGVGFHVVLSGGVMQARVEALCVEDRTAASIGYKEVLSEFSRQVAAEASK